MAERFITYEAFGAVGDGVHDDLPAIIAAHEEANRLGLPVKAREGALYYTGTQPRSAIIQTDVDWTGAVFIADHRDLDAIRHPVFRVTPSREEFPIEIPSLSREQRSIEGLSLGSDVFVRVWDDTRRHYIRRGGNANLGSPATDCFVLTAEGEIKNRIMWDFPHVTKAVAKPIDSRELVIRGGTLRSIANEGTVGEDGARHSVSTYSARHLAINRSHVTLDGFTDEIVKEQECGCAYSGAVSVRDAAYVTLRNCRFMGRRYFYFHKNGQDVPLGSYAVNLSSSAFVSLIGLRQTNDIMDSAFWGLMGSNFCKDLYLEDCTMSRFDAHQGVTNCTIRASRLGWMCLNAIGYGDFLVEDCQAYGNALINLRRDYGSLWNGSFTVRRCHWIPRAGGFTVFNAVNDGAHDFGYDTSMPHTVTIDGLVIEDEGLERDETPYYVLPDFDRERVKEKIKPHAPTELLLLGEMSARSGRVILPCAAPELYPNLRVEKLV